MTEYVLEGYSTAGSAVRLTLPFIDEAAARAYARGQSIDLYKLSVADGNNAARKIPYQKQKIDFYEKLALFIEKGVPEQERSRELIRMAEAGTKWASVLRTFLTALENVGIGDAMDTRRDAFPVFERNLLRNTPVADLPQVLRQLSTYYTRITDSAGRIRRALIMPAAQIGMVFVILGIYAVKVIPGMRNLDDDGRNPLPWGFRTMGAIDDWFAASPLHVALVIALLALLLFGLAAFKRSPRGNAWYDRQLLKNKVLKVYLRERQLFTLFTLELIFAAGNQRDALAVARDAAIGPTFFRELDRAHRVNLGIETPPDGQPVALWADSLRAAPTVFPREDRILLHLANHYDSVPTKELAALAARKRKELERDLEALPGQIAMAATVLTVLMILGLLFVFIIPFSSYIAHFR